MVYHTPSPACARCRLKRTRCDRKTPSCTQCVRAGELCTGYRQGLVFRDETSRFYSENRSHDGHLQPSNSTPRRVPISSTDSSLVSVRGRVCNNIGYPCTPLSTPVEELSICFFLHNWINKVADTMQGGLPMKTVFGASPIILRDLSTNLLLRHTVICLGKASLAVHHGSSTIKLSAEADYVVALRLVNKELNDVVAAKSDQTLITVMLLGIYELSISRGQEWLRSWTKHVNGIAALLQLRGTQQFNDAFRLRLFLFGRAQVTINCLRSRIAIPAFFAENIPSDAAFDTDAERCTNRLVKIIIRLCNSRVRLTKTDLPADDDDDDDDEQEPSNVIAELLSIDSDFENWAENYPDCFQYAIVSVDRPTETIFSNYYHVYSSTFSSVAWNNYRSARMLVNAMLKRRLLRMQTTHAQLMHTDASRDLRETCHGRILKCQTVEHRLALDVCASMTFSLGLHDCETSTSQDEAKKSTLELDRARRVMWPLYRVGTYLDTADPIRHWIAKFLIKIADLSGFQQAALLSQALTDGVIW